MKKNDNDLSPTKFTTKTKLTYLAGLLLLCLFTFLVGIINIIPFFTSNQINIIKMLPWFIAMISSLLFSILVIDPELKKLIKQVDKKTQFLEHKKHNDK